MVRQKPRSRLRTVLVGCGLGCGTATLALLIVLGFLYSRITAMPPTVARPNGPPDAERPPTSGGDSQQAPPPVDQQTEEIRRAVQSNQPVPVSLRVSEAQINGLIAENGASAGQLRDLRVTIRDRDLLVTGVTTWAGRQVYLTAALTPQATNGRLGLRIDSAHVGNLALPGPGVARLQAEIDRAMANSATIDERVHVEDAAVLDGELVVSGRTVPR